MPFINFPAQEWSKLRANWELWLTAEEIDRLRSLNDPMSVEEVERIYLPLSRLLSRHVEAVQGLFEHRKTFLGLEGRKTPFILGIAGSVAVGKSTTARLLRELMVRWPSSPKVDLITTDGFLYPNAELERRGLMTRKGFPESYDRAAMIRFLTDIKAGKSAVKAPVYSHLVYDVTDQTVEIDQPDILIFEGLNVLQSPVTTPETAGHPLVSDFFDFAIYVDADVGDNTNWYIERFMRLRETAFKDPDSYFHRYAEFSEKEALAKAEHLWSTINLLNLRQNIGPTKSRADLVLRKGPQHLIEEVSLKRL